MAKMQITFDGFSDLAYAIDKAGGDLKPAVDEALNETQKIVQENVTIASAQYASKGGGKGYSTGEMFKAIKKDPQVEWHGNVAEVGVGFNLSAKGGFHSLFIMYGTPRHGKNHPGMAANKKVYNAIKGLRTRKQIAEVQEKVMQKHLNLEGD